MVSTQLLASTPGGVDAASTGNGGYSLLVAKDSTDVRAAQRLRYRVFAEEMGARLHSSEPGIDIDQFDRFCDHLVVRHDATGEIVGTYRMLPPDRAKAAGMLYSDTEFDLRALQPLRDTLVETGRSCVHPDHRSGAVVGVVWAGIARYMLLSGHKYLAGCASVPLNDGGELAAGVWDVVSRKHFSPEEFRVRPLRPWDHEAAPHPHHRRARRPERALGRPEPDRRLEARDPRQLEGDRRARARAVPAGAERRRNASGPRESHSHAARRGELGPAVAGDRPQELRRPTRSAR